MVAIVQVALVVASGAGPAPVVVVVVAPAAARPGTPPSPVVDAPTVVIFPSLVLFFATPPPFSSSVRPAYSRFGS